MFEDRDANDHCSIGFSPESFSICLKCSQFWDILNLNHKSGETVPAEPAFLNDISKLCTVHIELPEGSFF